jgi:hypothetical protein
MLPIAIIVYSCLATATFDDFDPHQVNAAAGYVARHPGICRQESPLILETDVSLEECQSQGFLNFMPEWMQEHPDRVWLGNRCEPHQSETIEFHPLREQKARAE